MKTNILIDWREWKDYHQSTPDRGEAVRKLNELLAPHGVHLNVLSDQWADYLHLEATSDPCGFEITSMAEYEREFRRLKVGVESGQIPLSEWERGMLRLARHRMAVSGYAKGDPL